MFHLKPLYSKCLVCIFFLSSLHNSLQASLNASVIDACVHDFSATSTMRMKPLIKSLTDYGILDEKDNWAAQIADETCPNGDIIGKLLIELGRSFRTLNTLKGAVTALNIRQIIKGSMTGVDYWLAHAVKGEHCPLVYVESLLKRMVDFLPISLLPPQPLKGGPLEPISPEQIKENYDVIIVGAGTGGIGAAIQAARMGCSVLLLEETDWIGGQMTTAGVTTMDEGCALVQERGLYRELCSHILSHYQALEINPVHPYGRYCVEPHIAREILHRMLGDAAEADPLSQIDLLYEATVTHILKDKECVIGVEMTNHQQAPSQPRRVLSKIVVDATEWGDIIPLTGARYRVGNCTSDARNTEARTQALTWTATIKHYPDGVPSELCIKTPPPSYDKAFKCFQKKLYLGGPEEFGKGAPWSWQRFIGYRAMPNSLYKAKDRLITRTQLNFTNDIPTSIMDIENLNKRKRTCLAAINKTLNLLYYIQTELQQTEWAIANDQGYDTPYQRKQMNRLVTTYPQLKPYAPILYHFSIIPYVRESRRIIGLHTLSAREIERHPNKPVQFPHTIALGDYAIDLHSAKTSKHLELDLDRLEDIPHMFGERGNGPFAIPFECFIPEKIDGFLVAEKNFSQSRMVNGATRLQPHTLLMGQAVGVIAALSVQKGIQPRDLDPLSIQHVLLNAGCTLSIESPKSTWKSPEWKKENLDMLYGPHLEHELEF